MLKTALVLLEILEASPFCHGLTFIAGERVHALPGVCLRRNVTATAALESAIWTLEQPTVFYTNLFAGGEL